MTPWTKQALYGLFLAGIVALPTAAALTYYLLTGDQTFRPLAQRVERVSHAVPGGAGARVGAQLRLHDATSPQAYRMAEQIRISFQAKGVEMPVYLLPAAGDEAQSVTYIIGANRVGPFPLSRAAQGLNAAVEAYRARPP